MKDRKAVKIMKVPFKVDLGGKVCAITFAGKNLRTVNPKEIAFMISVGVTQPG